MSIEHNEGKYTIVDKPVTILLSFSLLDNTYDKDKDIWIIISYIKFYFIIYVCNIETDKDKYIEEEDDKVDSEAIIFSTKNYINFINNTLTFYELDTETWLIC